MVSFGFNIATLLFWRWRDDDCRYERTLLLGTTNLILAYGVEGDYESSPKEKGNCFRQVQQFPPSNDIVPQVLPKTSSPKWRQSKQKDIHADERCVPQDSI